jgi:hypothetical protein
VTHPGRRRKRLVALVVAVAAAVGAGTAVVLQQWDEGRRKDTEVSASPSPSPTAAHRGTVPDGWVAVTDPLGFGLSLPEGWERKVFSRSDDGTLTQVDYTPDGGEHFLRIAVDTDPDYNDPFRHLTDLDRQLSQRLVDYRRIGLQRTVYRDRQAALWEYTWTALAKDIAFPGPRRAVDEAYLAPDGTEYALYMSSPVEDWATAREQFRTILRSWQPASS